MRLSKKRKGFTLIEILAAVCLGGLVLTGMLMTLTSYLKLREMTDSPEVMRKQDAHFITTKLVLNEISRAMRDLTNLKACEQVTFKKLKIDNSINKIIEGDQIVEGDDPGDIAFYWQSKSKLPFVKEDNGGITECFLKYEKTENNGGSSGDGSDSGAGGEQQGKLKLYYRSLGPEDKPRGLRGERGTGKWNEGLISVVLLEDCAGINYGYTEMPDAKNNEENTKITFYGTPKFRDGENPDLPEFIQILLKD